MTDELFAPAELDWRPVDPRYAAQQSLTTAAAGVLAAIVLSVLAGLLDARAGFVVAALSVIAVGVAVLLARRRARSWRYALRAEDLFLSHGLMFRELVAVPYGRMQAVEVNAGPVARAFGLASVRLVTASPKTGAVVPGLDRPTAAHLRDRLAELGEARGSGL